MIPGLLPAARRVLADRAPISEEAHRKILIPVAKPDISTGAMASLILAALFFAGIHLGVAGTGLRDRLVAAMGRGYQAAFAIASAVGLVWMVIAYNGAPYLPSWGILEWWKPVAIVLMLPAFLLVVIGLATPNPTAMGQDERVDAPPVGIVRVTRHPFLTGVALWAFLHLVANGDWASFVFFGAFVVVGGAGTVSIDAKRRRTLGDARWQAFVERTSILPFGAIAQGRNSFSAAEIGVWRPLVGVLAYALMLGGHVHIIGVSPFP
jgi:uncharacterized membrane protein